MTAPKPRFWIALAAALAALTAGALWGQRSGDWSNFARSGAVLVIIGAVITAYDYLRAGSSVLMMVKHLLSRDRPPSETLGLALMVIGTIIWAFGDLAKYVAP